MIDLSTELNVFIPTFQPNRDDLSEIFSILLSCNVVNHNTNIVQFCSQWLGLHLRKHNWGASQGSAYYCSTDYLHAVENSSLPYLT